MVIVLNQVRSTSGPTKFDGRQADDVSTQRRDPQRNAATGASAAGVRAVASQMVAFYFRAPVKPFFPARVE